MDADTLGVDCDRHGHVLHIELVDGLHAEICKGEDLAALDGLGDEVGSAADGHKVDGLVVADGSDGSSPRSALPTIP